MNEEEYISMSQQAQLAGAVTEQNQRLASNQYYLAEAEKNLIVAQLEVDETLSYIYHLLRQDVLVFDSEGNSSWKPIPNSKDRILTDYAIDSLMKLMRSYINKETLLSNFDEKKVRRRMLEFSLALNANMFMKYELYFRTPSFEECKEILRERIEEQVKRKLFAGEMVGINLDKEKIRKELLAQIEKRIEYELEKIKEERRKQNLREYELLFVEIKSIVEAIHERAYRGEERSSLRRHAYIAQLTGTGNMNQADVEASTGGGPFKWLKK